MSPEEEALVEKAMAKIRRAQGKGKKDVKLTTEEYAVLMRRKELKDAESRRRNEIRAPIEDVLPQHPSPEQLRDSQIAREPEPNYPPMGYFPPPATRTRSGTTSTISRPRSGTASTASRPPSRSTNKERRSSPFRYSYVNPPQAHRHVSDTATGRPLSRGPLPPDQAWAGTPYGPPPPTGSPSPGRRHSQAPVDPFLYMTGSAQAAYHGGGAPIPAPAPARRHVSGPAGEAHAYITSMSGQPRASPRPRSRRVSSEESAEHTTEEDEDGGRSESTSDELDQGARVDSSGSNRGRSRDDVVVVEESPDPGPEPERETRRTRTQSSRPSRKKSAHSTSPIKRKPVSGAGGGGGGSGGGRRRKK
ncbi:hypothetical protein GQ53DRAFT_823291 [Thozetella sp. PMI_491]|nr:hypothetical protein GQ53DRAFT_823291 [Thozetella sp. PMI_491]